VSSYLGATAANIRRIFDLAQSRPLVLFIDEIDTIAKHRDAQDDHGELKRVVTALLQLIDWFRGPSLLIAASNHQDLLDSALWRRFDQVVQFVNPTSQQIVALLARLLRQIQMERTVKLELAAQELLGLSFADVERCALDSMKMAILAGSKVTPEILKDATTAQRRRARVPMCGSEHSIE
jgi:SpoVK/Ycf46/Vps4 family AAA+-type ATPase